MVRVYPDQTQITMRKLKPNSTMLVTRSEGVCGSFEMSVIEPIESARPKTKSDRFSILSLDLEPPEFCPDNAGSNDALPIHQSIKRQAGRYVATTTPSPSPWS